MGEQNVYPLDRIRRYRSEMNRRKIGEGAFKTAMFLIELGTIATVLGRGLKIMSRELGYHEDEGRRIRFPV